MPEFFRSVVAQDITEADGTKTYDLQIRPTSHLVIGIKVLNLTANTKATVAQILGALEKVEVLRFGATEVAINGLDLYALNCILLGHEPWQENVLNLENSTRMIPLIVPFGRKLYDPKECFPETKAGEAQLKLTIDIADTGYDGYISQVEQIELPAAKPTRHLRYMTKDYTPSATGAYEVDLPRGNQYAGILMWGTTVPTGTVWTTTIDKLRLLVNNTEKYFGSCNWEALHGELINRCNPPNAYGDGLVMENAATAYTQNADTGTFEQDNTALANHIYLDFSPNKEDDYLLDTKGLTGLSLDITAGDTNATRIIPVELMTH